MEPQGVQPSLTTLVPELFGPGGVCAVWSVFLSFHPFHNVELVFSCLISSFSLDTQPARKQREDLRDGMIHSAAQFGPIAIFSLFCAFPICATPSFRSPILPSIHWIRTFHFMPSLGDFTTLLSQRQSKAHPVYSTHLPRSQLPCYRSTAFKSNDTLLSYGEAHNIGEGLCHCLPSGRSMAFRGPMYF